MESPFHKMQDMTACFFYITFTQYTIGFSLQTAGIFARHLETRDYGSLRIIDLLYIG